MARPRKNTLSPCDRIARELADEIASGRRVVGSDLPSVRALAERFESSRSTLGRAIAALAKQGYVEAHPGARVRIVASQPGLKMADSLMLFMPLSGHIHADLAGLLQTRARELGLFVAAMDSSHLNYQDTLRRVVYSDARYVVVNAGSQFNYSALTPSRLGRKHVIAVLAWESNWWLDRVHRVLVDHAAGTRLLVEHLWNAGHRRLLVVAPPNMLAHASEWNGRGSCPNALNVAGTGLTWIWDRLGGRSIPFFCHHEAPGGTSCPHDVLGAHLGSPDPPTAVVGLRDVDAWDVQDTLRRHYPGLLPRLTFFGNGDTPWSRMAHQPFSTLNWNLEKIADAACGIIRDAQAGKTFASPVVRLTEPKLVERKAGSVERGAWLRTPTHHS